MIPVKSCPHCFSVNDGKLLICVSCDKRVSGFYVTIIRGKQVRYLAGPFDAKPTEDMVEAARKKAVEYDCWCDFDYFGTAKITAPTLPTGIFQI